MCGKMNDICICETFKTWENKLAITSSITRVVQRNKRRNNKSSSQFVWWIFVFCRRSKNATTLKKSMNESLKMSWLMITILNVRHCIAVIVVNEIQSIRKVGDLNENVWRLSYQHNSAAGVHRLILSACSLSFLVRWSAAQTVSTEFRCLNRKQKDRCLYANN